MTWLSTNLHKRLSDHSLDFQVEISQTSFAAVKFDDAADHVARSLIGQKNFVAFSGGYDSEFVVRRLHKCRVEFTPIIVEIEGLEQERVYAYKTCNELNINPHVIKLSIKDCLQIYFSKIIKPLNGTAWPSAQYVACEYAASENGTFIDGGHCLGDGLDRIADQNFYLPEWDFYCHALFPNTHICNFFLYTPQIAYASLDAIRASDETWSSFKSRIFNISCREKIRPQTSWPIQVQKLLQLLEDQRPHKPKRKVYFGNKRNLMSSIRKNT